MDRDRGIYRFQLAGVRRKILRLVIKEVEGGRCVGSEEVGSSAADAERRVGSGYEDDFVFDAAWTERVSKVGSGVSIGYGAYGSRESAATRGITGISSNLPGDVGGVCSSLLRPGCLRLDNEVIAWVGELG